MNEISVNYLHISYESSEEVSNINNVQNFFQSQFVTKNISQFDKIFKISITVLQKIVTLSVQSLPKWFLRNRDYLNKYSFETFIIYTNFP